MLVAHALFKATLFMVVGTIDHETGTRDLRRLSGLGRSTPLLAVVAAVAGASMAGLPPMTGFVAKESVFGALTDAAVEGEGTGLGGLAGWLVVTGVVLGSALTAAYTARFLWGAFARKPDVDPVQVERIPLGFLGAPLLLAALSLVLGFGGHTETEMLLPYVAVFPAGSVTELALWHGPGPALALSVVSIGGGLLLFWAREPFARLQARLSAPRSAERAYFRIIRFLDRAAVEVTGLTQRGSVSAYLSVILLVVVVLPRARHGRGGRRDARRGGVGQRRTGRGGGGDRRRRHPHHAGPAPPQGGRARGGHRLRHRHAVPPPRRPPTWPSRRCSSRR
ncbi:proton-conducting transporter membrane subunit [Nocardioides sp. TF02-7]|uniref:proton-conducting transporter transmembrane domain-containing protein n=1 Tax=Nocardioides sp. TF02-7 TaxID=2917724 RepID=UPI001F063F1F|nr:proton-conducting transporter membrane subunit [Nocardioides sp. TF02-7]UMG92763.1 hypothetical protein MF408_24165 [Nocardioides sp. TF02-7]